MPRHRQSRTRRTALNRLSRRPVAVLTAAGLLLGALLGGAVPATAADEIGRSELRLKKSVSKAVVEPLESFSFTLAYNCFSNDLGCEDAVLEDTLPAGLVLESVDPLSATPPATVVTTGSTVRVTFTALLPVPNTPGSRGLEAGAAGSVVLRVHAADRSYVDGDFVARNEARLTASNADTADAAAVVLVALEPHVAVDATKTWALATNGPDGATSPNEVVVTGAAKSVDLGFTQRSNLPVQRITVSEPASPTGAPAARSMFDVLDLAGLAVGDLRPPTGATSVTVTAHVAGPPVASHPVTTALSAPPATDLLAGLDPGEVTGLSIAFEGEIPPGETGGITVRTEQRAAPRSGGSAAGPVNNEIAVVAVAHPLTSAPATATASFLLRTATLAATATKSVFTPSPLPLVGESARVTLTATNTSNVATTGLRLVDPVTAGFFAPDALLLAGFGSDGAGAGIVWPAGATEARVELVLAGGTTVSATSATRNRLPALASFAGLSAWSEVRGLTVTFTGQLAVGAKATVPYRVAAGPSAVATDATHAAPMNCAVAQSLLGATVSASSTQACRPLTLVVPVVAADTSKRLTSTTLSTTPGSTTVAVLAATPKIGSGRGNTGPTSIVLTEPGTSDAASTRWWQVFEPVAVSSTPVAAGERLTVQVTTALTPAWTDLPGTAWPIVGPQVVSTSLAGVPGGTAGITGVRFVLERADAAFTATDTVRAHLKFAVRTTATGGGAFVGGEKLKNCSVASAVLTEGADVRASATSSTACAEVTGVAPLAGGDSPLTKSAKQVVLEGSRATVPVTLGWSTNGRTNLSTVDVSDLADATTGRGVVGQASYFDAFDLVSVGPITSGKKRDSSAWDPYLVFDRITAVQIWDVSTSTWRALTLPDGCDATLGCVGSMPLLTLTDDDRAKAGAVRLVYAPRSDDERATVISGLVAAGDWRLAVAPPAGSGVAAVSAGDRAREVSLSTQLRDTLRSAPTTPVNNARAYNATATGGGTCLPKLPLDGCAGKVVNDGLVRGASGAGATPLGHGTSGTAVDDRTVSIVPMALAVTGTKTWLRADAYGKTPHDLGLPEPGTAQADYPHATLTLTATNATASSRVDQLSLTEPAVLRGDGTDPFDRFRITSVAILNPAGDNVTGAVYLNGSTTAATAAQLDDPAVLSTIVQIKVVFTGRIDPGASGKVTLGTQLLAHVRGTGAAAGVTPVGEPVTNTVGLAVEDDRVCLSSSAPGQLEDAYPCVRQPVTAVRTDHLTVSARSLEVEVTKSVSPTTVLREAAPATPVTVRLGIQNVGNDPARTLTLTDAARMPAADATTGPQPAADSAGSFYDAVTLSGATLSTLPTGVTRARLDVLTGSDFTVSGGDLVVMGGSWTKGHVTPVIAGQPLALPVGLHWADVVGVRLVLSGDDPTAQTTPLATPGAVGELVLTGALRAELRSGGAPSATGGTPATLDDATPNPGESLPGTISNTVTARADSPELASPVVHADAPLQVRGGVVSVAVSKSPTGNVRPGEIVPFQLTVRHTGTAALPDPVVVDHLPTDAAGQVLNLDLSETGLVAGTGSTPWAAAVLGGTDELGTPQTLRYNPTSAPATIDGLVVPAHSVAVAWPAGAVLRPGQTVTVTLPLQVRSSALGATTNTVGVSTASTTRYLTSPTCTAEGSGVTRGFAATAAECLGTVPLTVISSGAFTSRKDVRAWPTDLGAIDTRAGHSTDTCTTDADGYAITPCAAIVQPGGLMRWRTSLTAGNQPASTLVLVDMLPAAGDLGESSRAPRETAWRPLWDGATPTLDAGAPAGTRLTVLYTTVPGAEVVAADRLVPVDYSPSPDATWSATAPVDPADVTGMKFVLDFSGVAGGRLPAGANVRIAWIMRAPHDLSGDAWAGQVAWNTFGYEGRSDALYSSQPRKAGVLLAESAVEVTKAVVDRTDYGTSVASAAFEATVACTVPTDPTDPAGARTAVTLPSGGVVRLERTTGFTARVAHVPVGARCTVTETDDGGASTVAYSPAATDPTAGRSAPVEVTDTATVPVVAITNTFDATGLTIRKTVDASSKAPVGQVYAFTLGCTLEGAALALPAADAAFTLTAGASRTLTGLPVGAVCEVTETTSHGAAIGYRLLGAPVVATNGVLTLGASAAANDVTVENAFSVLDLTKAASATSVRAGEELDYTLGVANTGPAATSDVRLRDVLPADVSVVAVDAPTPWSCTVTGVDTDGFGGELACSYAGGAALAAGATAPVVTITVAVRAPVAVDELVNAAVVRWTDTGSPNPTPTEREDTDQVVVPVRWIDAQVAPVCAADARALDYDLSLRNIDAATPVAVSWFADADLDGVPDGPAVQVDRIPAGDLTGRLLWPGTTLDEHGVAIGWPGMRVVTAGETPTWLNLVLDPTLPEAALRGGVVVQLDADATTSFALVYPGDSVACAVTRTVGLDLTKTADVTTLVPGAAFTYRLGVRGAGYGATTGTVLTDRVPSTLRVTGVTAGTSAADTDPRWRACTVSDRDADGNGGLVTCELEGWIGHGQQAPPVQVAVQVAAGAANGSVVNTARVAWPVGSSEVFSSGSATVTISDVLSGTGRLPWTGADARSLGLLAVVLVVLGVLAVEGRRRWTARS